MTDSITRARMRISVVAALGAALILGGGWNAALAAGCPTVADPQGIKTAVPYQLDRTDFEKQAGHALDLRENPLFAAQVQAGKLPPVEQRVPQDALVYLPYEACGTYGGTLRGVARAPESGTSGILSWRQVSLVRMSDDLKTIVPNVARAWEWNADYTEITFTLRRGHKWSDGAPFTADDVVFFFNDIVLNKELNPNTPKQWVVGGEPVAAQKVDDLRVKLKFAVPFPGMLYYFATNGSYFAPYAPKHHYVAYHAAYNPKAEEEAKKAGFEGWVQRFGQIYHRWKDAETLTAHALTRPTLESHVMEVEPDTQRRVFVANPYYFKVDSSGQQLPYVDRHHERFLNRELQILAILNGEVDFKSQGIDLSSYPVLKEGEAKGGYAMRLPPGQIGPSLSFNITHANPDLRKIYGDLRFRQAMSLMIDRPEIKKVLFFDLGTPVQATPAATSFVSAENVTYMTRRDLARANALLDEMGMKKGSDGWRTTPDGKPFTLLWEYSTQMAEPDFVKLMLDYFKAVGINVNAKEQTSQATRENAKAGTSDINMEWDVPYEPTLIADIGLYIPFYTDISPLFGIGWRQWALTDGKEGEEPPAWAKRMFEIAKEWRTVVPGSARYMELGRELVKLNQENMTIIGTVGELPRPTVVAARLHNVPEKLNVMHFNFGYNYAYRADQWYLAN